MTDKDSKRERRIRGERKMKEKRIEMIRMEDDIKEIMQNKMKKRHDGRMERSLEEWREKEIVREGQ